jgi:hypothetical protein
MALSDSLSFALLAYLQFLLSRVATFFVLSLRPEVVAGFRISDGMFARNEAGERAFADALFYHEAARSKINRPFTP